MLMIGFGFAAVGIAVGGVGYLNQLAHKGIFPNSLEKAVHALYATIFESFTFVGYALSYFLALFIDKWVTDSSAPTDQRPVLLVHGYLHNASAWTYLMPKLHYAGFGLIYTINLWPPIGRSIDEYAAMVEKKVRSIAAETGQNEVIVIGHSMGGLVGTRAALNLAEEKSSIRISHVASLGSPFRGARAAYLGYPFGQNARDLLPGSEFTQRLQKDLSGENSAEIKFLEIGSHMDQLVSIDSACLSLGGHFERSRKEFKDLGHLALLCSPSVAETLKQWLLTN